MTYPRAASASAAGVLVVFALLGAAVHANEFGKPRPVAIDGLPIGAGGTPLSTEEPYVSRDGRFLFFNSGESENNKDLHFAEWRGGRWRYRGALGPNVNDAKEVQGNATMDRAGRFYFVDSGVSQMVRSATFDPLRGELHDSTPLAGMPERKVELFAQRVQGNMGVEVSADGDTLYFDRATWALAGLHVQRIVACDILFMTRAGDRWLLDEAESRRILASVDTPAIEYAEAISTDDLELFFTRMSPVDVAAGVLRSAILRATRPTSAAPFGVPQPIRSIGSRDFVEAPALTDDGHTLYYHQRVGTKFKIFQVVR